MANPRWRVVTKDKPCPSCGKTDWCAWAPDGDALRCMREGATPSGMVAGKTDRDGGKIYRYPKGTAPALKTSKRPVPPAGVPAKFADVVTRLQSASTPETLAALATATGVPQTAWAKLSPGWADAVALRSMRAGGAGWEIDRPENAWAIPEYGGDGNVVGASLRAHDGRKGSPSSAVGARRGLVVPSDLHERGDPVLIVEGASDVAAGVAMGLAVVGRPSNRGGAEDLAKLLEGRQVLVVGEHDAKPGGKWPGRDGAIAVAGRLAAAWGEAVPWTLPPQGSKDIRQYLTSKIAGGLDANSADAMQAAGRELLTALQANKKDAKPVRMSAADRLVTLAQERYRLGVTKTGDAFAVEHDGPAVAVMFRGGRDALRNKLAKDYRQATGRIAPAAALADALATLEGMASDAEPESVALRLAELPDAAGVVIDLGDSQGRAAIITPNGWSIEERSPVLFRRTALTGVFTMPAGTGDLRNLRGLLNVRDEDWPLVVGWLVAACMPNMPHPVLMLGGEQGTGKSTAARLLAELVDPSPAPLRAQPRDEEAWAMMAAGSWVAVIDNVSGISTWFSDALCKAATGDAFVRRRFYTDGELVVSSFRLCVVLTSIDAGALRGDLGDRLLLIDLERIPDDRRRTEADLHTAWACELPGLIAGLLTAAAKTLAELPSIKLEKMSRLADFERILAALDKAMPELTGGKALAAMKAQRERIAGDVVEADVVASAVAKLADSGDWTGTAGELLAKITPTDDAGNPRPPKGWPAAANALSGRLKRITPALRAQGVEVVQDRESNSGRRRVITLRKLPQMIVQTVRAVQDAALEGEFDGTAPGDLDDADDQKQNISQARERVEL